MPGQTSSVPGTSTTQTSGTSAASSYTGQRDIGTGMPGVSPSHSQGMQDQAKDKAREMAGRAQEQAASLADQAKQQLSQQAASQKDRAAEQLHGFKQVLHQTSTGLRDQNHDAFAGYVDQLASQVDNLTGYLRNHTVQDMISDVERLARREPALFLGGAMLLGLFGSRFLKSSSPDRGAMDREYRRSYGYGRYAEPEGNYAGGYRERYREYEPPRYGGRSYEGYESSERYGSADPSERLEGYVSQNTPYGASRPYGQMTREPGQMPGRSATGGTSSMGTGETGSSEASVGGGLGTSGRASTEGDVTTRTISGSGSHGDTAERRREE